MTTIKDIVAEFEYLMLGDMRLESDAFQLRQAVKRALPILKRKLKEES